MEMPKYGDAHTWRSPCMEMSKYGDAHIWRSPCMEIGDGQIWRCPFMDLLEQTSSDVQEQSFLLKIFFFRPS